jgi:hypothetical protein
MLHLAAGEGAPEPVAPAHLAAILEGLSQAQRREFASDGKVEAAFRRFDRDEASPHAVCHNHLISVVN